MAGVRSLAAAAARRLWVLGAARARHRARHHCSHGLLLLGWSFFLPNSLATRPSCLRQGA